VRREQAPGELRFGMELKFVQDGVGVTATLGCRDGRRGKITALYVIAADGAQSPARCAWRAMDGKKDVYDGVNILFGRPPAVDRDRPAALFARERRLRGAFLTINAAIAGASW
jgi:2-polyprenyl-6-methoxyphenol hydroxylase-like FAD-dependent oxidoreductase